MSANTGRFVDMVKDTASAVSGSTVTLNNSPTAPFQAFGNAQAYANADVVPAYRISDASNWEVSYGAYTSAGTTLARAATPIASSNAGSQVVSFTGTITVAAVDPAAAGNAAFWGVGAGNMNVNLLASATTTLAPTVGLVYYIPVWIKGPFNSVVIHFDPTTLSANAAAQVDFGLMSNLNGAPNTRLGQQTALNSSTTGSMAAAADNATSTINMSSPQFGGLYWLAIVTRTAAATFSAVTGVGGGAGGRETLGVTATTNVNTNTGYTQTNATIPSTAASLSIITSAAPYLGVVASL